MLSGTATTIATNAATIESLFIRPPLDFHGFRRRGLPAPPSSASPLRGRRTRGSPADTLIRVSPAGVGRAELDVESLERLADEDLMPLVERKEPAAFEIVYDRHGGAAYSLAYRIVGNRNTAEDVTQEAFLSVWRSGARFDRTRGSVRTWLLGVVRNRAIDVLRRDSGRAPAVSLELESVPEQESQWERTDTEAL